MSRKGLLVLAVFLVRLGFSYGQGRFYPEGESVRVRDYIVSLDQNRSECVVILGEVTVKTAGRCRFKVRQKVEAVGRVKAGLIDRFLGQISLMEGEIRSLGQFREISAWERFNEEGLAGFKTRLEEGVKKRLPPVESALVLGVVLGEKENLPWWFYNNLVNSGTIHIIVASGFNVMVVGGTVIKLLAGWLHRRLATLVAVLTMVGYSLLTGGQPPVMRAVIMGSLVFIGQALGRSGEAGWSLFLTAMVMLIVKPLLLTSVSFQLSVAACVGLFWLEPKLVRRFEGRSFLLERSELLPTISAQVFTLPLILFYFGRMNLIAILSNLLILPLVPWLMAAGVALMVVPSIWPAAWVLARLMVELIKWFGV